MCVHVVNSKLANNSSFSTAFLAAQFWINYCIEVQTCFHEYLPTIQYANDEPEMTMYFPEKYYVRTVL